MGRRAGYRDERTYPAMARLAARQRIGHREPHMVPAFAKDDRRGIAHDVFLVREWLLIGLVERPGRRPVRYRTALLQAGTLPFRRRNLLAVQLRRRPEAVPFADAGQRGGVHHAVVARDVREAYPCTYLLAPRRSDPRFGDDRSVGRGEDGPAIGAIEESGADRRLGDVLRDQRAIRLRKPPAHVRLPQEVERVPQVAEGPVALGHYAPLHLGRLGEQRVGA